MPQRFITWLAALSLCTTSAVLRADEPQATAALRVPPGFRVIRVAGPPLVQRPMFAALNAQGHLLVLDSGGLNGNDRNEKRPDVVRVLTDSDGDGVYDRSQVFADQIVFGTGLACYGNSVFITSPPSLWRFDDTNGDGIADQRTELVTGFAFNQSCTDDLHGACVGPDGRIYFLPGRFRHKVQIPQGPVLRDGVGPWLMRCRPDGRDVEFVSGAVGNPVEVAFLPTGDAFLQGTFWAKPTVEGGLRDAVVHAVSGGEYSVRDRDYSDRIRTGDFLPALVPLTATAPSGLTSKPDDGWGPAFQDNLFTAHFNTGKILRHRLTPLGATFSAETQDFVTATTGDVHFTDVLADADSSLLVVDTGGWFRACCPASGSSKPDVLGAIYRIVCAATPKVADPYGRSIDWDTLAGEQLTDRLDDRRSAVRERAVEVLARRGASSIAVLANVLDAQSSSVRQRQHALWALCRIDAPAARQTSRRGFEDSAAEVRQIAASVAALHRDGAAFDALVSRLRDQSSAVRREAAHALGRIGRREAVPFLLEAVASCSLGESAATDRFLEHALIHAVIDLKAPESVRLSLQSGGYPERRAALIALDQIPEGGLNSDDLRRVLALPDPSLQQAAIAVLLRRPQWIRESVDLVDRWLQEPELDEARSSTIIGVVRSLRTDPSLNELLDRHLAQQDQLSLPARRTLLLALAGSGRADVSARRRDGVAQALRTADPEIQRAALHVVETLSIADLAPIVRQSAADPALTTTVRLAAQRTLVALQQPLAAPDFEYLRSRLAPDNSVPVRLLALDVLTYAESSDAFLQSLVPLIPGTGPVELPRLLPVFSRGKSDVLGSAVVQALGQSSVELPPEFVEQILKNYGNSVREEARPLLERWKKSAQEQHARLDELEHSLAQGDGTVELGRELFFGKAQCHVCHAVAGRGAKIGPELSTIGAIRSQRDLLEAIVFPSASFARGYEPIAVVLKNGQTLTGLAGRETAEEIVLRVVQDQKPVERSVSRDLIDFVQVGSVSAMPNGLDRQLQPHELRSLMLYLRQLKSSP